MAYAPSHSSEAQQLAALLFERHSRQLRSFCLQRLRHSEDADEAVQATYLRALGALHRGVRPYAERAWLLTIARNVCSDVASAPRRHVEVQTDPATLARTAGPATEQLLDSQLDAELGAALAALPDAQRRALLLRELRGLSYREIAQELAVSVSAVESLIFRARRSVAATLRRARRFVLDLPTASALLRSLASAGPAAKVGAATAVVVTTGVATTAVARDPGRAERAPAQGGVVAGDEARKAPVLSSVPTAPTPAGTRVGERASTPTAPAVPATGAGAPDHPGTVAPAGEAPVRKTPSASAPATVPTGTAVPVVEADVPLLEADVPLLEDAALPELTAPEVALPALPEVTVPELEPSLPPLPIEAPTLPTPPLP